MKLPAYPSYKSSGVAWIGDIPEDWHVRKLKFAATINDEILAENTSPDFEFEYVDISSVNSVDGIVTTEHLAFDRAPSRARRKVRHGDTIISTVRTYLRAIAPIKYPPQHLIVSTGFAVVRPRNIDPAFMAYALRESAFVESVVSRSVGVSYPAVNASEIGDIPIPIPGIVEQQAIAHYLDREIARIDQLVAKKRELIERLKEKRKALVSRAVTRGLPAEAARTAGAPDNPPLVDSGFPWIGTVPSHWSILPFRRITRRVDVGIAEAATHAYSEEGVPLVRSTNIKSQVVDTTELLFIEEEFAARLRSKALQGGDIVTTRTGANLGVSAVIPPSLHMAQCFTLLISTLLSDCDPYFYNAFINADPGASYFAMASLGAGQHNISVPILKDMPTVRPPLSEQRLIVAYIEKETTKLNAMVERVEVAIDRLQEYRTALITAAVTGKIDVREFVA